MRKPIRLLYICIFAVLVSSCKDESEKTTVSESEGTATEVVAVPPTQRAPKKELTPEDHAMLKSVMVRLMNEPDLKKFASYLVTAELANKLAAEGEFTVFAPSNTAFESLTTEKINHYSNIENRKKLEDLLKSHIVLGKWDKETLLQNIGKNGKATLKTLDGTTLTATKSGETIVISDKKSGKATVVKGSIEGSNGFLYVVDGVLNAN